MNERIISNLVGFLVLVGLAALAGLVLKWLRKKSSLPDKILQSISSIFKILPWIVIGLLVVMLIVLLIM